MFTQILAPFLLSNADLIDNCQDHGQLHLPLESMKWMAIGWIMVLAMLCGPTFSTEIIDIKESHKEDHKVQSVKKSESPKGKGLEISIKGKKHKAPAPPPKQEDKSDNEGIGEIVIKAPIRSKSGKHRNKLPTSKAYIALTRKKKWHKKRGEEYNPGHAQEKYPDDSEIKMEFDDIKPIETPYPTRLGDPTIETSKDGTALTKMAKARKTSEKLKKFSKTITRIRNYRGKQNKGKGGAGLHKKKLQIKLGKNSLLNDIAERATTDVAHDDEGGEKLVVGIKDGNKGHTKAEKASHGNGEVEIDISEEGSNSDTAASPPEPPKPPKPQKAAEIDIKIKESGNIIKASTTPKPNPKRGGQQRIVIHVPEKLKNTEKEKVTAAPIEEKVKVKIGKKTTANAIKPKPEKKDTNVIIIKKQETSKPKETKPRTNKKAVVIKMLEQPKLKPKPKPKESSMGEKIKIFQLPDTSIAEDAEDTEDSGDSSEEDIIIKESSSMSEDSQESPAEKPKEDNGATIVINAEPKTGEDEMPEQMPDENKVPSSDEDDKAEQGTKHASIMVNQEPPADDTSTGEDDSTEIDISEGSEDLDYSEGYDEQEEEQPEQQEQQEQPEQPERQEIIISQKPKRNTVEHRKAKKSAGILIQMKPKNTVRASDAGQITIQDNIENEVQPAPVQADDFNEEIIVHNSDTSSTQSGGYIKISKPAKASKDPKVVITKVNTNANNNKSVKRKRQNKFQGLRSAAAPLKRDVKIIKIGNKQRRPPPRAKQGGSGKVIIKSLVKNNKPPPTQNTKKKIFIKMQKESESETVDESEDTGDYDGDGDVDDDVTSNSEESEEVDIYTHPQEQAKAASTNVIKIQKASNSGGNRGGHGAAITIQKKESGSQGGASRAGITILRVGKQKPASMKQPPQPPQHQPGPAIDIQIPNEHEVNSEEKRPDCFEPDEYCPYTYGYSPTAPIGLENTFCLGVMDGNFGNPGLRQDADPRCTYIACVAEKPILFNCPPGTFNGRMLTYHAATYASSSPNFREAPHHRFTGYGVDLCGQNDASSDNTQGVCENKRGPQPLKLPMPVPVPVSLKKVEVVLPHMGPQAVPSPPGGGQQSSSGSKMLLQTVDNEAGDDDLFSHSKETHSQLRREHKLLKEKAELAGMVLNQRQNMEKMLDRMEEMTKNSARGNAATGPEMHSLYLLSKEDGVKT